LGGGEGMSCGYCDIKKYVDSWNNIKIMGLDYGAYTTLYMFYDGKDKKFGVMAVGDGRAEIKIKYCPNCGSKMTEE
jgi:hypothetical protein